MTLSSPDLLRPDASDPSSASVKQDSLNVLCQLLQADREAVEATLSSEIHCNIPLVPKLSRHLIGAGGKRIRPLLTLATARGLGYRGPEPVPLAACIEFLHSASLLHDDVVDESALRRGKETAHQIYGNQAAVLVGDFLFARSFQLMTRAGTPNVLEILANATAKLAEGQVFELETLHNPAFGKARYLDMITAKTAALFSAACEIGASISLARPEHPLASGDIAEIRAALASYGTQTGIAFQLVDDLLDYVGDTAETGKIIGNDFREGKITYPVLVAYEAASHQEKKFLQKVFSPDAKRTPRDFEKMLALINQCNGLSTCRDKAADHARLAADSLENCPKLYLYCKHLSADALPNPNAIWPLLSSIARESVARNL